MRYFYLYHTQRHLGILMNSYGFSFSYISISLSLCCCRKFLLFLPALFLLGGEGNGVFCSWEHQVNKNNEILARKIQVWKFLLCNRKWKVKKICKERWAFFQRQLCVLLPKERNQLAVLRKKRGCGASDDKWLKINIITNNFTEQNLKRKWRNKEF